MDLFMYSVLAHLVHVNISFVAEQNFVLHPTNFSLFSDVYKKKKAKQLSWEISFP